MDAIREILDAKTFDPNQIAGIGVDGQSWSAIPIDKEGKVLARTPIWMDTRARDICDRVKRLALGDKIFQVAGNDFLPSYTTPKMLWFKENKPEVFQQTHENRSTFKLRLRWIAPVGPASKAIKAELIFSSRKDENNGKTPW